MPRRKPDRVEIYRSKRAEIACLTALEKRAAKLEQRHISLRRRTYTSGGLVQVYEDTR